MGHVKYLCLLLFMTILPLTVACQQTAMDKRPSIVVTYSILGSIVQELVGDRATVNVSIPNGLDLHEWEPSARDIEKINRASLVICNGLNLEGGMDKCLESAQKKGVRIFTASDHIQVRHVGKGEGIHSGDPDQEEGASDPHLWTDPLAMKAVVSALVPVLKEELNIDSTMEARGLEARLDELDQQVAETLSSIAPENRKLATGHESMGYFTDRYGFKLVGVIIPALTSQANVSAADLSSLKKAIRDNRLKTIFTEQGTSASVAEAIANETGVKVVELNTHKLPGDGSYFTFLKDMAGTITNALR